MSFSERQEPKYGGDGEDQFWWQDHLDLDHPGSISSYYIKERLPSEKSDFMSSMGPANRVVQPGKNRYWGEVVVGDYVIVIGDMTETQVVIQFCIDGRVRVAAANSFLFQADSTTQVDFGDVRYVAEATEASGRAFPSGILAAREKATRSSEASRRVRDEWNELPDDVRRALKIIRLMDQPQAAWSSSLDEFQQDLQQLYKDNPGLPALVHAVIEGISQDPGAKVDTNDGVQGE